MNFGTFQVNFWYFSLQTNFISPRSHLSQIFQTNFIFNAGFKFASVLAFSHTAIDFPRTFCCACSEKLARRWYLLKRETTWNDLQQARNDLKRPTTTYNYQETTWNNPKRVRHNLQWPEHAYNKQRKDAKRPTTSRFSDYFTIWGKRFSSLAHFPPNIWL